MTHENKVWSWILQFCRDKKLDPTVDSNWKKGESKFTQLMGKGKIKFNDDEKKNNAR